MNICMSIQSDLLSDCRDSNPWHTASWGRTEGKIPWLLSQTSTYHTNYLRHPYLATDLPDGNYNIQKLISDVF